MRDGAGDSGISPLRAGTTHPATVRHGTADGRQKHGAKGFHSGRGKALDLLVALARTM